MQRGSRQIFNIDSLRIEAQLNACSCQKERSTSKMWTPNWSDWEDLFLFYLASENKNVEQGDTKNYWWHLFRIHVLCIKWLGKIHFRASHTYLYVHTIIFTIPITQHVKELHTLNPCANKLNIMCSLHVGARNNTASYAASLLCVIYVISKTKVITKTLLTLPVLREAEVVALFHATVHHRHHDFRHSRWWKLHCATTHVLLASLNEEARLTFTKPAIYNSNDCREYMETQN